MIVSEEQVRNVLIMHRELKAENKRASIAPTKGELPKLSSHAQEVTIVKVSLSNAPDIREERVAAIKDDIAQGSYQPTSNRIASKMVNRSLVDSALGWVNFK